MSWYVDTWRTPYWRRVLQTVCALIAFVLWQLTLAVAGDGVRAGERWGAIVAASWRGVAAAVLLLAAAGWLAARGARARGRSAWAEVSVPALAFLSLAAFMAGKVVAIRDARDAGWLFSAACVAMGAMAVSAPNRRWLSWAWLAGWLAAAVWLAARSRIG